MLPYYFSWGKTKYNRVRHLKYMIAKLRKQFARQEFWIHTSNEVQVKLFRRMQVLQSKLKREYGKDWADYVRAYRRVQ